MRRFLINSSLVIVSLLFSLIIVEAVLKVYNPFEFRMRGDRIVLPQNFKYEITNDRVGGISDKIVHTKNALGFRGPSPPSEPGRLPSIITIGGSTTESFYQSDGRDWPALLARQLAPTFPDLWLNNAGLDGHSTIGHLHLMRQFVVGLKPDVVLLLVGSNEVGIKDFKKDDARLIPGVRFETIAQFVRSLVGYSEVAALSLNLYRYWHTVRIGMAHGAGFILPKDSKVVEVEYTSVSDSVRERFLEHHQVYRDAFHQRLLHLIDITQGAKILPVLITQPTLVGIGKDPATGVDLERIKLQTWRWGGEIDGQAGWRVLESYNDVTRKLAKLAKVPLIDLSRQMPKSTSYFYDFVHFTDEGAAEVARIIYQDLCPILSRKFEFAVENSCD